MRARQPSRRFVLAGGSAAPFVTGAAAGSADPAVTLCTRWLAIDAEQRRLQLEWGTLEGWLMTKRSWHKLSPEQRAAIPEGVRLSEIDALLGPYYSLHAISEMSAETIGSVCWVEACETVGALIGAIVEAARADGCREGAA